MVILTCISFWMLYLHVFVCEWSSLCHIDPSAWLSLAFFFLKNIYYKECLLENPPPQLLFVWGSLYFHFTLVLVWMLVLPSPKLYCTPDPQCDGIWKRWLQQVLRYSGWRPRKFNFCLHRKSPESWMASFLPYRALVSSKLEGAFLEVGNEEHWYRTLSVSRTVKNRSILFALTSLWQFIIVIKLTRVV